MEKTVHNALRRTGRLAGEILLEVVWPTRCAVCDAIGEAVLCPECAARLPFVDACLACPACGAPYGRSQCTECNGVMLGALSLDELPLDGMASALSLDEAVGRLVVTYKDGDERRLAKVIAELMVRYLHPAWKREGCAVSYVPDTAAAFRRRGFDHAREIAEAVAACANLEVAHLLERPHAVDQRKLGRAERIKNMRCGMRMRQGIEVPSGVILIDDVCTTGSTIFAAAGALREAGVDRIYGLTLGRALG